jgi:prepilin-type processing-associated H-X9-DG protein
VVIAVISVLASLLMPTTLRAMQQGETTRCKSNLAQLGHGLTLYIISHEQLLPPFGYYRPGPAYPYQPPFWTQIMATFLHPNVSLNEALAMAIHCPAYSGSFNWAYGKGYACNYGHIFYYSGRVRPALAGLPGGNASMRVTEVRAPSTTMFLMDGERGYCYSQLIWPFKDDRDGDGIPDSYTTIPEIYNAGAPFRHGLGCNALFADGHVRLLSARQWLTDMTLWDPRR